MGSAQAGTNQRSNKIKPEELLNREHNANEGDGLRGESIEHHGPIAHNGSGLRIKIPWRYVENLHTSQGLAQCFIADDGLLHNCDRAASDRQREAQGRRRAKEKLPIIQIIRNLPSYCHHHHLHLCSLRHALHEAPSH